VTPDYVKRYARHLVLKEIGGAGQQALLAAKVAIVGAGGLGGPAGLYLAAAGVGHITLIDDDAAELSNLQRQVQFAASDVGQEKAAVMANKLGRLNPEVQTDSHIERLTKDNAKELLSGHDIILDGVDDFATRFAINDAAIALGIPLVSGALGRFDGQVSAFRSDKKSPCYRCFVPAIPPDAETCSEVGVVGALAGVIGSMMALEAIKIITGAGKPLFGKVWLFDGLKAEARTVTLPQDPNCPACSAFRNDGD